MDDSTRLLNTANLRLAGSDGIFGANNFIELFYHNSAWIEAGRSYNRNLLDVASADLVAVSANTGGINVVGNVEFVNCYSEVTAPLVIRKALNGMQGQRITLFASGPSNILVIVNSAANDCFVSTSTSTATQFRLASSGSVTFIRSGVKWIEITPIWANSSVTYST